MIYSSSISIGPATQTITSSLLEVCRRLGSAPALIDSTTDAVMSYQALGTQIQALARHLQDHGLTKGSVVGLVAGNSTRYPVIFHAVLLAGGVLTPMNPLLTADELIKQLRDSNAAMVLYPTELAPKLESVMEQLGSVRSTKIDSDTFLAAMQSGDSPHPIAIDLHRDLAALPYSSGTSGMPKGVMLNHYNLAANTAQSKLTMEDRPHKVVLAILPFFHIYGMGVILNLSLIRGDTVVVMHSPSPPDMLIAMQKHRVTDAYLVPPLVLFLAKAPAVAQSDLSALREIVCAAAPLDAELGKVCAARLNCIVSQGYGMTEASPTIAKDTPQSAAKVSGSVGFLVPGTQVRLVDPETLQDKAEGESGEILVRGPQVMMGYLGRPEANAEVFVGDGWMRTGDMGRFDDEGRLFLVDRIKELIKYKGYQVVPSELEGVVLEHPDVADAAVIASPDVEAGEVPKAFVVLKPDRAPGEQALMDFVAQRVAPYKKIRRMEFVSAIPKSASGKILRRVLIDQERASRA